MRSRFLTTFLVSLPAVLGASIWLVFRLGWVPQSIIYMRFNLGLFLLAVGLFLSGVLGVGLALVATVNRRSRKQRTESEVNATMRQRRFLSRLDHELKNPLTAIVVEVANLESEIDYDSKPSTLNSERLDEISETVNRLKHQVARLNDLLKQLHKLGDLESRPFEREPIRLDQVLTNLVDEFRSNLTGAEREISLRLPQIPWPLPQIEGDVDLLDVALRNLMDNAVKFTDPGEAIQVRAFEDSTHVIVEIADKGPGISENELPHVWEELYRGEQARGVPGSGLGLALAKAIVELHGGHITLRSRLNQGTVAIVRLPASR
jgi:two-component system OmpR family sensor kinase